MSELVFILMSVALIFALAMRQAPLWMWAAVVAAITFGWLSGIATGNPSAAFSGLSLIAWLPAIALALLAVPDIRRAVLVAPAFRMVKKILPRVSATEQEALDAGTIGFDAELFSGRPDWARLPPVPPITLTEEDQAFLAGPTDQLPRLTNDWQW